jgi:PAS domain S-box-containing protein
MGALAGQQHNPEGDALLSSSDLFQNLIDALPVPIYYKSADGRYLGCNTAFERLVGMKCRELVGKSSYDVILDPDARKHVEMDTAVLSVPGSLSSYETVIQDADGSEQDVVFYKSAYCNTDGSLGGSVGMILDITARRRVEVALRESEEQYRAISELTSDLAFAVAPQPDGNLKLEWVAGAFQRVVGYGPDEVNRSADWLSFVYPDDRDIAAGHLEAVLAGRSGMVEYRLAAKGGEIRLLRVFARPVWDETGSRVVRIYAAAQDVTEYRRKDDALYYSQAALRRSEARYRELVERVPAVIYASTIDVPYATTYISPQIEALTGYTAEEWISDETILFKTIHPDDRSRVLAKLARCGSTGEPFISEHRVVRRDGEIRWVRDEAIVVRDSEDEAVLMQGLVFDITGRKQAEAEREQLIAELDAFAHTVAHDLKSPLSSTMVFADMLMEHSDRLPPEKVDYYLETIVRNGHKMNAIINELLLLASVRRLDEVDIEVLDMARIVDEACGCLTHMIEQSEAEITFDSTPDAWPLVRGYAPWVEEVWTNYLSNAIKYGGEPPCIELGAARNGATVRFWVRDNGPGIALKDQARLFSPFASLAKSADEGHGLGLSIVQRIVERLGGDVSLESTIGEGSTFSFTLPAAIPPRTEPD